MMNAKTVLPEPQSQELKLNLKDASPTLCLVALGFAISWLSLGDDRTTTKGWFPAWFGQFRSFESGTFPYSPFSPTSVLLEGGIPSLFSDVNLGEDLWHANVLALLGPVLYIGFRRLTGPLLSFGSAATWVCLEGNSVGNFIAGYLETATLLMATSCTCLLWSISDSTRQERTLLWVAGASAAFAVGVKQSFLPFLLVVAAFLYFERGCNDFGYRRSARRRSFLFLIGCLGGFVIQLIAWWLVFPGLEPRLGVSRFVSGGGKADSVVALLSSAANSLSPLNSVVGLAIVATVGLAIRDNLGSSDVSRSAVAGFAFVVGVNAFFLWGLPVNAEQGAFRLASSVWLAVLFFLARRRRPLEVRVALGVVLGASAIVFILAFRELVVPARQTFLITMRGLAAAPIQLGGSFAIFLAGVGLLSALANIRIGSSRWGPAVQCVAVSSGVSMLFQLPLGGVLLNGHVFGFGVIVFFASVASQSALFFQTVVRGVIIMLALSGIVREAVNPYQWYGVVGSNDLAHIDDRGVFYSRGSSESDNRFEHALLSRELAQLEAGSRLLVGVRNAGLIVGQENLSMTQECLVLWFDICPEHLADRVFGSALQGNFDYALWSPENPDVLFANTLMWRDDGGAIGNPKTPSVTKLQTWLEELVVEEPWRLLHVAWPGREFGTRTLLIDLRGAGDVRGN
jgi:hypothetical protein